jgi:hypothetical protein
LFIEANYRGTIKVFVTPPPPLPSPFMVLQIDIGYKHDVLICFGGIAKSFENLKYVKTPHESIVDYVLAMFSRMGLLQT